MKPLVSFRFPFFATAVVAIACTLPRSILCDDRSSRPTTLPAGEIALEQMPIDAQFGTTTFRAAIEHLRQASGANIFVDWGRLERAGIDGTMPVALSLRGVTLREALDRLMTTLPAPAKAAWAVRDGMVTISTRNALGWEPRVMRFYFVDDLLHLPALSRRSPQTVPATQPPESRPANVEALVSLVRDITGPKGSVRVWSNWLIVGTTREHHIDIERLLRTVREVK